MRSLLHAALFSLAVTGALGAQEAAGAWRVDWAQAVRNNRDGTLEIQKWGGAELQLTREGDAVRGTWTTHVAGDVRWTVHGTVRAGRLTLEATENDSTDPQLAAVERMRWRGTISGDRIEGEMTLIFRGAARDRPWRPWRAKRAGG